MALKTGQLCLCPRQETKAEEPGAGQGWAGAQGGTGSREQNSSGQTLRPPAGCAETWVLRAGRRAAATEESQTSGEDGGSGPCSPTEAGFWGIQAA